jgi:glucan 1,3-beta-glucosidase
MATFSIISLLVALRLFLLVSSAPTPIPAGSGVSAASNYWLASIARQGTVPFGNTGFQVFRNVKDFGAVGDGASDFYIPGYG